MYVPYYTIWNASGYDGCGDSQAILFGIFYFRDCVDSRIALVDVQQMIFVAAEHLPLGNLGQRITVPGPIIRALETMDVYIFRDVYSVVSSLSFESRVLQKLSVRLQLFRECEGLRDVSRPKRWSPPGTGKFTFSIPQKWTIENTKKNLYFR